MIIGFVSFIILSLAFTTFIPPGFKNLKILPKDISEKALDSIMHNYSISLGERCDFCHVHNQAQDTWDMASDENPYKSIARKMMLMTTAINKLYFKPEDAKSNAQLIETVRCYTCHKGSAIPVSLLPPKEGEENK